MTTQIFVWATCGLALGVLVTFTLCRILIKRPSKGDTIGSPKEDDLKEQKRKYESLLAEANAKCAELDSQLKAAINGKIEDSVQKQLAAIDKFKKQIRDLEDELSEKDDDLSDAKKKLSRKEDDITELQDSLHKEQKISKILHDDLESTKLELEETIANLELKAGSLDFIQEILSAKDISTNDIATLTKNIDHFESFIKGQYMDLNAFLYKSFNALSFSFNDVSGQKAFDMFKTYYTSSFDQWASTKKKSWLAGKTTIAFVGEFSAGKTSIVNRILSLDNPDIPQLPVSAKATTAIPTYIAGGPATTYNFISGDGRCKTILEDTFKKVSKDILNQIKGVSALIKYFVMTYDNPNLKGLTILDTPGFNSNDNEDKERTFEVINECDALFWVVDVNAGNVNLSSLSVIKDKLNKPFFIVINKVDTKADSEVDKVEELIRSTLANAGLYSNGYIRFSTNTSINTIMEPVKTISKISVRDTFVSDVESDLSETLNILVSATNEARTEYNKIFQEGEKLTTQFRSCLSRLKSDCDNAAGIPQFKEGFKVLGFGSDDKYMMTMSQARQLQNLLTNVIAETRVNNLDRNYKDRMQKAGEIQKAWTKLCDIKSAWQKANDCMQQFKNIIKNFE